MNLQQLRYVCEVARRNLNMSEAAEALYTSQPGVSKQISALEDELGVEIFIRHGKRLTGITEPGRAVLRYAEAALREIGNLKRVSDEFREHDRGTLTIATTHTQARYVLPPILKRFSAKYPAVRLVLHQGNPVQVATQAANGEADLAIATEAIESFDELVSLPCYQWNRKVVVPQGHPLANGKPLTLEMLAQYPIVTYDDRFTGRSKIDEAFATRRLTPNVVLTALDSDVIKAYVELGLGVGILADMAYDPGRDDHLVALDASRLFAPSTTRIALRKGTYLRDYVYDFVEMFAPKLTRRVVDTALEGQAEQYEL